MEKIKNTLGISKGEDMSGIDVDQSAMMQNEEFAKVASNPKSSDGKGTNTKDINSAGGPTFGRESKIPEHKSNLLNKLDPRIGYTPEEADASVERYESKYGKPDESRMEGKDAPGSSMAGMGGNQSALMQNEQFAKEAGMPHQSTSSETPQQDSEGHS
jgi:hypothetical protein